VVATTLEARVLDIFVTIVGGVEVS